MGGFGPIQITTYSLGSKGVLTITAERRGIPRSQPSCVVKVLSRNVSRQQIKGRLLDRLQAPRVAQRVLLVRTRRGEVLPAVAVTVTDGDGAFTLGKLPAGEYQLMTGGSQRKLLREVKVTSSSVQDLKDITY